MKIFTVSFFGHREVENIFEIEVRLEKIISELIREHEFVEFLIGRDGEFDIFAASVIRRIVKKTDYHNTAFILVLPYMKADYRDNEKAYLNYYDEVEVCPNSADAHFKAAIQIRNRWMVDRSNLVVCCIDHKSGGAYRTFKYAEKVRKKVINVAEVFDGHI